MDRYIIGLDIGSSKICAAAGKFDSKGQLQVLGVVSEQCSGIKKSVVVDIDTTSSAIINCIRKLERIIDYDISEVYISLSGSFCTLKSNRGVVAISSDDMEINQKDVDRVIESSKIISIPYDKEIIGVIPIQYIVDGHENIKDPIGMIGLKLEVDSQLLICESNTVNNIIKSVEKSSLKIGGMVLKPLAISSIVAREDELKRGILIIDGGFETIELSFFQQGMLKDCDMIPLGGNNITNDISICMKIPLEEAENLKLKYANLYENKNIQHYEKVTISNNETISIDIRMLNNIVEARIDELLSLIKEKTMIKGYYDDISKIILIGGGFSLIKGINDYSKKILNKPVKIGLPQYVGVGNPIYVVPVGVVKDVADSIKYNNRLSLKENDFNNMNSEINNNSNKHTNKVVSKIKDFLSEFF